MRYTGIIGAWQRPKPLKHGIAPIADGIDPGSGEPVYGPVQPLIAFPKRRQYGVVLNR
jgi:hypothetical protein